jgi:hypothetical protein
MPRNGGVMSLKCQYSAWRRAGEEMAGENVNVAKAYRNGSSAAMKKLSK